jgi:hypothetical protein
MTEVDPGQKPQAYRFGRIIALTVSICMVLATIAICVFVIPAYVARQVAGEASRAIQEMMNLQPRVSVNDVVVIHESKPIVEVALVTKDTQIEHTVEHTWLRSTKTLRMRAIYRIKAGFKLTGEPVEVKVKRDWFAWKMSLETVLPEPTILSVDQTRLEILEDNDGYWNKITPEDRELAINEMRVKVLAEAKKSGIRDDVKKALEEKMAESVPDQSKLEFRYGR